MMRSILAAIAGLMIACAPAHAVVSEAVELDAGPGGARLAPVWMMKCPGDERLVGIRIHGDRRVAGVRAICARVRLGDNGAKWLAAPALLAEPSPPPPPKVEIVRRVIQVEGEGEGTILRASSIGVTRERSSRALIITVKRPVHHEPEQSRAPVERITFRNTAKANDVICPVDRIVVGLRIGSEEAGRTTALRAVQIICGDGLGHDLEPVGAWPKAEAPLKSRKKRKASVAKALNVQRIDCGVSDANPHDGLAARSIFGTEDRGHVETIGLSCTDRIGSIRSHSRLYAAVRDHAMAVLRAMNWSTRIDAPKWLDGAGVAVCAEGGKGRACTQASADRYCAEVAGHARATAFAVGRYAKEAVVPGGERCARGACRAFASITCAL